MTELEYLEVERKKLWKKVLELEERLIKKTSDYEREASNHSRKASEYRNRCEESKNVALEFAVKAENEYLRISELNKIGEELTGKIK